MINRRSVPALHRACLHQRNQPGGKEPGEFLRPDSLKTDMTVGGETKGIEVVVAQGCLDRRVP